ncbi:AraC family transcriptional regulator [Photobacterium nomapromontoriensis]|uniref:AraC family transcriptional regulator n=1 Tax=Photobacterium nomapromontoriensis TaxID=2910237 RepID=UPI003D112012
MLTCHIETTLNSKELTHHGSEDFPCAYYDSRFSEFVSGEIAWHWHDELEFILVIDGSTEVEFLGRTEILHCNEALFINAGALHKLTMHGVEDCRILTIVFNPLLIGGTNYSRVYKKYIYPVIKNADLLCYKFSPLTRWQQQVIDELKTGFTACQNESLAVELAISLQLMKLWQIFCTNEPSILAKNRVSSAYERRIHTVLTYIHQHYADSISISAISHAANISESECYRLFRNTLKCTPNNYLLSYRLQKSTLLLLESRKSITEIAYEIGFNCPAYFAKKFRSAYGKTPKQFRQESALYNSVN